MKVPDKGVQVCNRKKTKLNLINRIEKEHKEDVSNNKHSFPVSEASQLSARIEG